MCKDCHNDPYLAGSVVVFSEGLRHEAIVDDHQKRRWVAIEGRPQGWIARCVSHHKGWVRVRLGGIEKSMREENVIAIVFDGMMYDHRAMGRSNERRS